MLFGYRWEFACCVYVCVWVGEGFKVLLVSCKSVRHTLSPHMEQHGTVVYESNKWLNMHVWVSLQFSMYFIMERTP